MENDAFENSASTIGESPKGPWGQDRRLEFIDFRLRWDGRLNRSDLVDFFGISVPQASLDIARYLEGAPANMQYDRGARVYRATDSFAPLYATSHPSRYLNELLSVATGVLDPEASFVGWRPPLATIPVPGRTMNVDALVCILRAIRNRTALQVRYQSMSRPEPGDRVISPHALVNDGFRWHVRAYCHLRKQFRDFVIARVLAVEGTNTGDATGESAPERDLAWLTQVQLVLAPHPALPEAHRKAIELDYGMTDGVVAMACRQALLFYALQHLGLREDANARSTRRPEEQQIVLKNRDELATLLSTNSQS
jgi:hypothetical protein